MRMDLESSLTAYTVVNTYSKEVLVNLLKIEADIKSPDKFVDQLILKRTSQPIETTFDLVECIKFGFFVRSRAQFIAMCTKVFQAIRIEVNSEMNELNTALHHMLSLPNTTIAIITFQPNEDRLVKQFVKANNLERITKKPIQASYHEAKKNPREKSAKLRIFKI